MLQNALVQLGLSEKEASAYIMLVRIGVSPVSTLAKRLSLKRVTMYAVLDSLMKRGYVIFQKRGACRFYSPVSPECILEDLERKNDELKMQLNLAKECVEKLQSFPMYRVRQYKSSELCIGAEAEEKLLRTLNKESTTYIISLSLAISPLLMNLLKLLRKWNTEVHISVIEANFQVLKREFNFLTIQTINVSAPLIGDLIIQNGKVMFLSTEDEIQLSIQSDSAYAELLMYLFKASHIDRNLTSHVDAS